MIFFWKENGQEIRQKLLKTRACERIFALIHGQSSYSIKKSMPNYTQNQKRYIWILKFKLETLFINLFKSGKILQLFFKIFPMKT